MRSGRYWSPPDLRTVPGARTIGLPNDGPRCPDPHLTPDSGAARLVRPPAGTAATRAGQSAVPAAGSAWPGGGRVARAGPLFRDFSEPGGQPRPGCRTAAPSSAASGRRGELLAEAVTANGATMRLIHTSDWHLGRTLHGVSLLEHQAVFLDWLVGQAVAGRADAVLVAGDIYDRAVPPLEAVALLDRTLAAFAGGSHPRGPHQRQPRLARAPRVRVRAQRKSRAFTCAPASATSTAR